MLRLPFIAVAVLVGCSGDSNDIGRSRNVNVKRVNVNRHEITSYDGSKTVNGYRGSWQETQYSVIVLDRELSMDGVLQTVRSNWPDRNYYTRKPQSWPTDSSIQGVLRGPISGVSHAQFRIGSEAGSVLIEFFAETNSLNEDFFASFFGDTLIDSNSYRFPIDGEGKLETSPLYPSPQEL